MSAEQGAGMITREVISNDERALLQAAMTGMPKEGVLTDLLGWLMHEIDNHAAVVTVAAHGPAASTVLFQRRLPWCEPYESHDHIHG